MPSIVTRFRFGDRLQDIANDLDITVKQVIAVLRENSKQWDVVND
ncbi:MAG: hypothetical protein Unbinned4466contig1000_66 [Prokaryotic dsDNA virus sp.]|nr:MAG: hypothetical protein Unbinned4466contig1000_66 [Prokaryotic dsDNA virus sp.]